MEKDMPSHAKRANARGSSDGTTKVSGKMITGATGNGAGTEGKEPLADMLSLFKSLDMLSFYQKQISENLKGSLWFGDIWQSWLQMAPTNLWQDILRNWSFSVINFTNQVKGNPELEAKIVKGVAGYGSQLGTIMDFLEVLAKNDRNLKNIHDTDDRFKIFRFVDLLDKINKAKGRPESNSLSGLI